MENPDTSNRETIVDLETAVEIELALLGIKREVSERIRVLQAEQETYDEDYRAGLLSTEDYLFFMADLKHLFDEQFKLLLALEDTPASNLQSIKNIV